MMGSLCPSYEKKTAPRGAKTDRGHRCDVLVIGSGAAGLTTAITAHHFGADVLVVEKTSTFGGTIGRMAVVPGNPLASRSGVDD